MDEDAESSEGPESSHFSQRNCELIDQLGYLTNRSFKALKFPLLKKLPSTETLFDQAKEFVQLKEHRAAEGITRQAARDEWVDTANAGKVANTG